LPPVWLWPEHYLGSWEWRHEPEYLVATGRASSLGEAHVMLVEMLIRAKRYDPRLAPPNSVPAARGWRKSPGRSLCQPAEPVGGVHVDTPEETVALCERNGAYLAARADRRARLPRSGCRPSAASTATRMLATANTSSCTTRCVPPPGWRRRGGILCLAGLERRPRECPPEECSAAARKAVEASWKRSRDNP
jgi:hypothetical protein